MHIEICVSVSQAAGVIHRALCLFVLERRDHGATLGAGSATVNLVLGVQPAVTACLATGVSEWRGANPVPARTAVIQPLGSVRTGWSLYKTT